MPLHKLMRAAAGGSTAMSVTQTAAATYNIGGASSWTISNVAIGAAPTGGRRRFVFALGDWGDGADPSSFNIGGSAATKVFNASSQADMHLYYREVSSGTTADISVTVGGTENSHHYIVWAVESAASGISLVEAATTATRDNDAAHTFPAISTNTGDDGVAFMCASTSTNGLTVTDFDTDFGTPDAVVDTSQLLGQAILTDGTAVESGWGYSGGTAGDDACIAICAFQPV